MKNKRLTQKEFLAKVAEFDSVEKTLTGALWQLSNERYELTESQKILKRKKSSSTKPRIIKKD